MTEDALLTTIDLFVSLGLKDVGYEYVSVDDGWAGQQRAADGSPTSNPLTFPQGMKFLADHAHSKGLKFGLYSSNSLHDCGDQAPGGQGFEQKDAETYACKGCRLHARPIGVVSV